MDVKENDVHRAARNIGNSVIDALQVKIAAAVHSGAIKIDLEQVQKVLDLVKEEGQDAIENSTNAYMRAFTAHKKEAAPK